MTATIVAFPAPATAPAGVPVQGLIVRGLNAAAPIGTVDTGVLSFAGGTVLQVGSVPIAQWATVTTTAAAGTTVEILEPGLYSSVLYVPLTGGGLDSMFSVTKDATPAQLVGPAEPFDPEPFNAGFKQNPTIESNRNNSAQIPISPADIAAGRNVLRAQAWDPIVGIPVVPGTFINPPDTAWRLFKIGFVVD